MFLILMIHECSKSSGTYKFDIFSHCRSICIVLYSTVFTVDCASVSCFACIAGVGSLEAASAVDRGVGYGTYKTNTFNLLSVLVVN